MPSNMENLLREFAPALAVRPFVQTYWAGDFNISNQKRMNQLVLPNGCIELIIHLSDYHCTLLKDGRVWTCSPEFTLLGIHSQPYQVQFFNNIKVFGIRIYPDGFRNVFGKGPSEFMSTFEDGVDVLGQELREFCLRIREANDFKSRVKMADTFIVRQLHHHARSYDYAHQAMQAIRRQQGRMDYNRLTHEIAISQRQLQREFKQVYGLTIKDYMRILRMNAVIDYMHSSSTSFTDLSYDHYFFDQSHFNREFKHFVGLSPKKYLSEQKQSILNKGF
ncbi:MAG: helix-turn-helix domain-containing protein [Cyclobacteriaceae bacterium]